jgi:Asp-tRNA(Asn)/Glu-tRNA(Gln) amidotransferase C subunit
MRNTHKSENFEFRLNREGDIAFLLGNAKLALSIDAAYELQYQLAEMLAFIETFEDLESADSNPKEPLTQNILPFENPRRKTR